VDLRYVWEPVAHVVPDADCIFATAWQTSEYVHEYPASKGRKYYLVMDFPPWFASEAVLTQTWRLPMRKIAICGWLQGLVQAATGLEAVSIPLGIDHDRFRITVPAADRQDCVAMMYSTAGYKDVATGIAALEHVRRQGANVSAVLFGPTGRRPAALPGWMDYRGTLSDSELVRLYNTAAVFVCSSIAEGFALPPAEAMACGCAIATTDCGGNQDYARHKQNALVCHPRDPRSLGDHVLRLLRDRELRLRLASAGAETMRAFTWERSTELLLEAMNVPHPPGVA
jgi:glycosyltransferase involved in cell wall biosynthesis